MKYFNKQDIFSESFIPPMNQNFSLTKVHKILPMYQNSLCKQSIILLDQSFVITYQIHQNPEQDFKQTALSIFPRYLLQGQVPNRFSKA